jgi:hypothetical protein
MTVRQRNALEKRFKEQVHDKAQAVDKEGELDWHSLTIGWALAHGCNASDAYNFATYIRYHTDLG